MLTFLLFANVLAESTLLAMEKNKVCEKILTHPKVLKSIDFTRFLINRSIFSVILQMHDRVLLHLLSHSSITPLRFVIVGARVLPAACKSLVLCGFWKLSRTKRQDKKGQLLYTTM